MELSGAPRTKKKASHKMSMTTFDQMISQIPPLEAQNFRFVKQIGEGAFSTVYLARDAASTSNDPKEGVCQLSGDKTCRYAIKVIQKEFLIRHDKVLPIWREKVVLEHLTFKNQGHPFINEFFGAFQDKHRIYFVSGFAQRGDMLQMLKCVGSFDEFTARFYGAEIIEALDFLHSCGVYHRDMKPENILLDEAGHIKLTDFGCAMLEEVETASEEIDGKQHSSGSFDESTGSSSNSTKDDAIGDDIDSDSDSSDFNSDPSRERRSTFVGTAHYVSPEMLRGDAVAAPCDVWAFGCILYQMLSGQPPFRAINDYHLMKKINQLDYTFPNVFPETAKDLITSLLTIYPRDRLNVEQIKEHEFFSGFDWKNITKMEPPEICAYLPGTFGEPEFYSDLPSGFNDEIAAKLIEENEMRSTKSIQEQIANYNFDEFMDVPDDLPCSDRMVELHQEAKARQIKRDRLERQAQEPYHIFCRDQLIIKKGLLDKKKGMFARTRMFILTEGPRLFYVKTENMEFKGEVPFCPQLSCEVKNFRTFFVHTPRRIYYLFDPESRALDWVKAIMDTKKKYEDVIRKTWENAVLHGVFPAVDMDKKELRNSEKERLKNERKAAKVSKTKTDKKKKL